jgi:hypothetical protein
MAYGERVALAVANRRASLDTGASVPTAPAPAAPVVSDESEDTPQTRPFKFHRGGRNNIPSELVAANTVLVGSVYSGSDVGSDRVTGIKRGRRSVGGCGHMMDSPVGNAWSPQDTSRSRRSSVGERGTRRMSAVPAGADNAEEAMDDNHRTKKVRSDK